LFGNAALKGDRFHLKLNILERPIAKKYCEGKVKRTLKRELKVLEIVEREANVICNYDNLFQYYVSNFRISNSLQFGDLLLQSILCIID